MQVNNFKNTKTFMDIVCIQKINVLTKHFHWKFVLGHINLCGLFYSKKKTIKFEETPRGL